MTVKRVLMRPGARAPLATPLSFNSKNKKNTYAIFRSCIMRYSVKMKHKTK